MYDPTAVAYLLAPQMFETRDVFVDVECAGGLTTGCTVVDLAGYLGEKPNATVCVGVERIGTFQAHEMTGGEFIEENRE